MICMLAAPVIASVAGVSELNSNLRRPRKLPVREVKVAESVGHAQAGHGENSELETEERH